ncbi:MAG: hypothetical protein VX910_03230 [Candidatus Latescibacterota bacterium]|nr:hypothetical protein [Candidatus Latescibacterota bacterium]
MISDRFPKYTDFDPSVPVWCITPDIDGCVHRFFDASSVSPSGRYVAITRFRFEERMPVPGDACDIVLVDLETGNQDIIAESRGFDTQLGAQVQWGVDDAQLFFNDIDCEEWRPFGVLLDPLSGDRRELSGTVYMASHDGTRIASTCLKRTGLTQAGYGVLVPNEHVPLNEGAAEDDGLSITDLETDTTELVASYRQIFETATPAYDPELYVGRAWYGFHVKWNKQDDRIMMVVRCIVRDKSLPERRSVISMAADGSDIRVAVNEEVWAAGGHHPDWGPGGRSITMNLKQTPDRLDLIRVGLDGNNLELLTSVQGSGHPTLHPNDRHILTDVYLHEKLGYGDGTTPIRWINRHANTEEAIIRINNNPPYSGPRKELRIDAHPAWDRDYKRIVFNGCHNGVRRVYLADLSRKQRE